ncbi:MAG: right-handed parallel beta-helix repeat-containing protein [Candidatus Heimdallarchaeaceae archaeon]
MTRKRGIIISILILTSVFLFFPDSAIDARNKFTKESQKEVFKFAPHEPIHISLEGDWEKYNFTGTGINGDPYRISNLNITTNENIGINIYGGPDVSYNTSRYFVIENCYIKSNGIGIYVSYIHRSFTIESCVIESDDIGISIFRSDEGTAHLYNNLCTGNSNRGIDISTTDRVQMHNNTCIDSHGNGIHLYQSRHSELVNNTFKFHISGISTVNSPYLKLINNYCNNTAYGISLSNSDYCLVKYSTCEFSGGSGIVVENSYNAKIVNSTLRYNYGEGIKVTADSCEITYNNIIENYGPGVSLDELSENCTIHHNKFIDNYNPTDNQTKQALDSGKDNFWYDEEKREGNYWSNHEKGNYKILGEAGSVDRYPLDEDLIPIETGGISLGIWIMVGVIGILAIALVVIIIRTRFIQKPAK